MLHALPLPRGNACFPGQHYLPEPMGLGCPGQLTPAVAAVPWQELPLSPSPGVTLKEM